MKQKVKYKYIDYMGKNRTKTITHDVPEFKELIQTININGKYTETTTSIEIQIDLYIAEIDKTELMDEYDMMMISDWEIVISKSKKSNNLSKVINYDETFIRHIFGDMSEDVVTDMIAIVQNNKDLLDGLEFKKQFDIVNAILLNSYSYGTQTLDNINNMFKGIGNRVDGKYEFTNSFNGIESKEKDVENKLIENMKEQGYGE